MNDKWRLELIKRRHLVYLSPAGFDVTPAEDALVGFTLFRRSKLMACWGVCTGPEWYGSKPSLFLGAVPAMRRYPKQMVKYGRAFMADVIDQHYGHVYTMADRTIPRSEAYVERFGFQPTGFEDGFMKEYLMAMLATMFMSGVSSLASSVTPLGLVGTGLGVASSVAQGNAEATNIRNQGIAQQQAAERNALILERQAQEDRAAASLKAVEKQKQTRRALASQTALLAAQGQDTTSGQPLLLADQLQQRGDYLADLERAEGERLAGAKLRDARDTRISGDTAFSNSQRQAKSVKRSSLLTGITGGVRRLF